jgi:hypothetical protein
MLVDPFTATTIRVHRRTERIIFKLEWRYDMAAMNEVEGKDYIMRCSAGRLTLTKRVNCGTIDNLCSTIVTSGHCSNRLSHLGSHLMPIYTMTLLLSYTPE